MPVPIINGRLLSKIMHKTSSRYRSRPCALELGDDLSRNGVMNSVPVLGQVM